MDVTTNTSGCLLPRLSDVKTDTTKTSSTNPREKLNTTTMVTQTKDKKHISLHHSTNQILEATDHDLSWISIAKTESQRLMKLCKQIPCEDYRFNSCCYFLPCPYLHAICQEWTNSKRCSRGVKCSFQHSGNEFSQLCLTTMSHLTHLEWLTPHVCTDILEYVICGLVPGNHYTHVVSNDNLENFRVLPSSASYFRYRDRKPAALLNFEITQEEMKTSVCGYVLYQKSDDDRIVAALDDRNEFYITTINHQLVPWKTWSWSTDPNRPFSIHVSMIRQVTLEVMKQYFGGKQPTSNMWSFLEYHGYDNLVEKLQSLCEQHDIDLTKKNNHSLVN